MLDHKLFIVNKSRGPTSFDVVKAFRNVTGMKKVGHAGTLDPLAEGVLLLLSGKATRAADYFMSLRKTYVFEIFLGVETTTLDSEGETIETRKCPEFTKQEVSSAADGFLGEYEQAPPVFSALKQDGRRLYNLARQGKTPDVRKRKVMIYHFDVLDVSLPVVRFELQCSRGTYVRALARDFAAALDMPAHVRKLVRTAVGPFTIKNAFQDSILFREEVDQIEGLDLAAALDFLPAVVVDEESRCDLLKGIAPSQGGVIREIGNVAPEQSIRILGENGVLFAVGKTGSDIAGEGKPIVDSYRLFIDVDN